MQISEIKARLALARVLAHYGWTPDARGRMQCPFHDDATPSMQVYETRHTDSILIRKQAPCAGGRSIYATNSPQQTASKARDDPWHLLPAKCMP